ncbi:DUF2975 domain-containing protein [Vibrio salinus]|uniref:DUF2975 domain-containing protein n=1 Tax=Vibrio salinus TaxID=2899784 RepID=UPI001E4A7DC9|nr:DUF2975 domain-containing protein [Vibrio salinus]MCE0495072.1 DUF2975 domain-containing protein [Vibrio salinus]
MHNRHNPSHISKLSRFVRIIFQVLFIVIPLTTCYAWMVSKTPYDFISSSGFFTVDIETAPYTTLPISYTTRILAALADLLKDAIVMYSLAVLIHLFRNYERCEIFIRDNVKCYQKLSYSIFYWVIGDIINGVLMSVILSFNNPVGKRVCEMQVQDTDILMFVLGCICLIISWVMKEGYALANENAYTV